VAGKAYLGAGNAAEAYGQFFEALDICPNSADAMLGMMLADTQWYVTWFNAWYNFLLDFDPSPKKGDEKSIATVVQRMIREYMQPINAEMFALAQDLKTNHRDVRFYLEALPMWTDGDHVVLDMGGEWDIADVYNLESFAYLMEGLDNFLLAFDLTFNYNTYAFWPPPSSGADIAEILHTYSGLLLALLADEDYPNFLTFLEDGEERLSDAGVNLGLGFRALPEGFAVAMTETDTQEDDVLGYQDANGNGMYDEGELYHTPYFGDLSAELQITLEGVLTMCDDLGTAMLDGGPEDVHPARPDWFPLSDLNWLLDLIALLWTDAGLEPINFPAIPLPVGTFIYNPPEDGLRSTMQTIAQYIYDATAPEAPEEVRP